MNLKATFIAVALLGGATAHAQSIGDILKGIGGTGSDIGSTISNAIEGVFTRTDISLADLTGEYESTGPAVTFKSENFLKKAGGIAGAAAVETKLQPYYKQYGLIGMPLVIDKDANFTLGIKALKLSGTIVRNENDGTFTFNVLLGGKMKVGQFTAYVEKSGRNLNLMFDATKLKELVSLISRFSGSTLASTFGKILESYDGMCVGFKMKNTEAPAKSPDSTTPDSTKSGGSSSESTFDNLLNILKNRK